jgi:hypothetical protein
LRYLDVYTNMPMCFYTIVPMPFEAWRGQKALIFLPWSLFFVNKFWSHYKGCLSSILSQAIAIDLTTSQFSPLQDTPPITTTDLLRAIGFWEVNGQPSISGRLWTCIDFHNNFEPTWRPLTSPFSFILLLHTFP